MTYVTKPETVSSADEFARCVGFNPDEQALLDAWDRRNVPDPLDERFAQRLRAAYAAAEHTPLRALEADDEAICAQMLAAAEAEADAELDEFREITQQHEPHLRRLALRLSGDREVAQDLAQETLTRAWSRFGQFKHGTNARAWLATILTRLFYDGVKHARVIRRAEPELRTLESAEYNAAIPSIADAQLWAAVMALEPDLRSVVERCYVQDMSYKAIADELNVPIGTIGTRLRRARERLRLLLSAPELAKP
jgi:RNA polymerase sigma-70 factor, ECF subfamily